MKESWDKGRVTLLSRTAAGVRQAVWAAREVHDADLEHIPLPTYLSKPDT
jgi:hypothetical protein